MKAQASLLICAYLPEPTCLNAQSIDVDKDSGHKLDLASSISSWVKVQNFQNPEL